MRYFYDLEFLEDGRLIELISIGIVAEDGREYYAINSEIQTRRKLHQRICSHEWLLKNVVVHLPLVPPDPKLPRGLVFVPGPTLPGRFQLDMEDAHVKPLWVIANEVRDLIQTQELDRDENELWAYYGAYDHVRLCQLWGPMSALPDGIPMFTCDLKQEALRWDVELKEIASRKDDDEHDALADARWNRAAWQALRDLRDR